jgi:hypothetical protein
MIKDQGDFVVGNVMVSTTEYKGHDPEFWAEEVTRKICGISQHAEPHIRLQAEAFRDHIYTVILLSMKSAIASDRVTITNKLEQQGHSDMAKIIKEL